MQRICSQRPWSAASVGTVFRSDSNVSVARPAIEPSVSTTGVSGDTVRIATTKGLREVPFKSIASAKLLLTDKLIAATAPLSTEGADLIKTEG